mgnify:CR=1 FL=1
MCGRYNLRLTPAELQQVFDLFREPGLGQQLLGVLGDAEIPLLQVALVDLGAASLALGRFRCAGSLPRRGQQGPQLTVAGPSGLTFESVEAP